jgi:hypothetical protein
VADRIIRRFGIREFSASGDYLGPVILLIGFVIEGVAIMYRPKPKKED